MPSNADALVAKTRSLILAQTGYEPRQLRIFSAAVLMRLKRENVPKKAAGARRLAMLRLMCFCVVRMVINILLLSFVPCKMNRTNVSRSTAFASMLESNVTEISVDATTARTTQEPPRMTKKRRQSLSPSLKCLHAPVVYLLLRMPSLCRILRRKNCLTSARDIPSVLEGTSRST